MKIYTIPQLAKLSEIPVSTLTKWLKIGDLTHFITWYVDGNNRSRLVMRKPTALDEFHDTIPFAYKWREEVVIEDDDGYINVDGLYLQEVGDTDEN